MNLEWKRELPSARVVKEMYPLSEEAAKNKKANDQAVQDVFLGKRDFHRAALITGREEIYQHINW